MLIDTVTHFNKSCLGLHGTPVQIGYRSRHPTLANADQRHPTFSQVIGRPDRRSPGRRSLSGATSASAACIGLTSAENPYYPSDPRRSFIEHLPTAGMVGTPPVLKLYPYAHPRPDADHRARGRRSDVSATDHARELALTAANAAAGKKAHDIMLLDVSDQLVITDCFVIASAPNERQVQAIVDAVEQQMAAAGSKPVRREGAREGRWVLLDFVDVVVHVQHVEERSFYGLERLWKDCPTIPFQAPPGGPEDEQT